MENRILRFFYSIENFYEIPIEQNALQDCRLLIVHNYLIYNKWTKFEKIDILIVIKKIKIFRYEI